MRADRFVFCEEDCAAMRRVQRLIDSGAVVPARDPWRRGAMTLARADLAARWARHYAAKRPPLWRRLWLAVIG